MIFGQTVPRTLFDDIRSVTLRCSSGNIELHDPQLVKMSNSSLQHGCSKTFENHSLRCVLFLRLPRKQSRCNCFPGPGVIGVNRQQHDAFPSMMFILARMFLEEHSASLSQNMLERLSTGTLNIWSLYQSPPFHQLHFTFQCLEVTSNCAHLGSVGVRMFAEQLWLEPHWRK